MEKQPYTTPTLVLMAGLAGSGKTTLATSLGQQLRWTVLSKDRYKTWLLEMHTGMTDEEIGRIAYDLVFRQARDLLVQQRFSLILDTAAHFPFILEQATNIVLSARAYLRIIHCTAIHRLREERLIERIASRQHPQFMGNTESINIKDEDTYFKHLPPGRLVIDTYLLSLEECVVKALEYLGNPERFGKA